MRTMPERMKTVPEWIKIVAESMPASIAWRRPSRGTDCDHFAGYKSNKLAASGDDVRTSHDEAYCRHL